MAYVYLLSTYGEHGAEAVHATLDRAKLPAALADLIGSHFRYTDPSEWQSDLQKLLVQDDEELAAHDGDNLSEGWGGIQLHVVDLV